MSKHMLKKGASDTSRSETYFTCRYINKNYKIERCMSSRFANTKIHIYIYIHVILKGNHAQLPILVASVKYYSKLIDKHFLSIFVVSSS